MATNDFMKQAARMRKDMERVGDDLRERFIETEAGAGRVRVVFNGQQELVKLSIDPALVTGASDESDVEMLEDVILAAISQGLEKSKSLMREEFDQATGGLSSAFPGLF